MNTDFDINEAPLLQRVTFALGAIVGIGAGAGGLIGIVIGKADIVPFTYEQCVRAGVAGGLVVACGLAVVQYLSARRQKPN